MARLDGKVAIVTGGGTGIGRCTALMLAKEGARVVISGRRKPPLEDVVAEIAGAGGQAVAHPRLVARPADAQELAQWTLAQFGQVDVLINNAGHSSKVRNLRWIGLEEWEKVMAVNVTGAYLLTQAVLPSMIARGGGTIVTVSSYAALRPRQGAHRKTDGARARVGAPQGPPPSPHHPRRGGHAHPRQSPPPAGRRR